MSEALFGHPVLDIMCLFLEEASFIVDHYFYSSFFKLMWE